MVACVAEYVTLRQIRVVTNCANSASQPTGRPRLVGVAALAEAPHPHTTKQSTPD